ncbi:MAG: dTMP kinase [Clostridia bacterium]|nr:dTMP kinase [Clostridia bacterium]
MGKFIVFEGIDGSGKSSQIRMLAEKLRADGRKVYITAEPTESTSGGMLRDALSGVVRRTATEMAALFTLDRVNHNVNPVNGIKKMLSDGFDVICDRYYYSSLAYQGSATDFEWVRSMNVCCPDILRPDVCIFLDVSPDVGLERIGKGDRGFTEIYEKRETLMAVRKKYFDAFSALSTTDNIEIINADRDFESIAADVLRAVKAL